MYGPLKPSDLFETICDGRYLIRGFTNRDIRQSLYKKGGESAKSRGKMSREFSKLRGHGLIRKSHTPEDIWSAIKGGGLWEP